MTRQDKKRLLGEYRICMARAHRLRGDMEIYTACREGLEREVRRSLDRAAAIEAAISQIPDLLCREVMLRRYVYGDTLEVISDSLNYSTRHLQRIINSAVDNLELNPPS